MDKKRGETRNGKQEKDEEEIKGRRRITEKRERKNKEMRIKSRVKKILLMRSVLMKCCQLRNKAKRQCVIASVIT